MTREEILCMAKDVGFYLVDFIDDDKSVTEQIQADNSESLYSFAALVAAAEREACAKVAESYEPRCDTCPSGVSTAIRARGA
jgi:hypothetical protein